jgi:four helix bundle protein
VAIFPQVGQNRDLQECGMSLIFPLEVYQVTSQYPKSELFGLTSQMRRAAVSIPANIAEGFKRHTIPDKLRFLNIAQSSIEESRYYLILSKDLGYPSSQNLMGLIEETSRLLASRLGNSITHGISKMFS